jgi:tetratricopeptide (TPR) repeat protein
MAEHGLFRGEDGEMAAAAPEEPKYSLEAAKEHLAARNFQKALNVYHAVSVKYPGNTAVEKDYLGAVESVRREAVQARDREDCAAAGGDAYLLLGHFGNLGELAKRLSFPAQELQDLLEECRGSLEKEGLGKYRGGDLEGAIALWESLLAFDPGNEEIRKAIATASVQMEGMAQESGESEEEETPEP